MKIEINTTVKGIETANYLLSLAIEQAKELPSEKMKQFDLSKHSLQSAENFRKSLIKAFLKT